MNHNYSFVLAAVGIMIGIAGMATKNPLVAIGGMIVMFIGIFFQIKALEEKK